jgi:beta-galactosidase
MALKLAVCDYPEHVNRETWLEFPKRMKAVGLTYVRIGEFAWSKLEPKRDQFEFAWLDEAIEALHAEGLRVVLGTPTATPPAWLIRAHPEILPVDAQGRVRDFGSRRHYDYSSQVYWQESRRIVEVLAKRYGNHPAIAGWQTDNEHGCHDTTRSYSPAAREGFQGWLEQKYGTVSALNEAWGTVFWSQNYSSFSEVGLHNLTVTEPNPSHVLDFYRYSSDQVIAYDRMQTAILREHSPGRFVTHNFMIFFSDFDHFKAAEHLDFVTWDNYPTGMLEFFAPPGVGEEVKTAFARTGHPDLVSFNHDIYRGLKTDAEGRGVGFWVMEQQCGQVNWATWNPLPAPGAVKLWTLQAMAHGADVVSYFRWQAATEAQELMHSGLLRYDGSDDRGALEVRSFAPKLEDISDAPVETKVALLHDYESLWAYDVQKHAADSSYWGQTMLFYMALRGLGLDVDIRHPSSDLSRYSVVVAPALHILSTDTADNLERYVHGGGQLVLGPRSGFRMPTGAVWKTRAPGPLAALAGVKVQNFDAMRPGLTSRVEAFDSSYNTRTWNESLEVTADDVQVLGTYSNDPLYGLAAVTHRRQDAGGTTYVGAWDEGLIASTLMHILGIAGVKYTVLEPGLRISKRGGFVYAQNWSRGGMPAPAPEGTTFVIGEALLEPAGVAVWQDKTQ